jgi:hypothetical protein
MSKMAEPNTFILEPFNDPFNTKAINSSIKELIYESLRFNDPYSIALFLYKLNHEKYFLRTFNKKGWVDKTELNLDSSEILEKLKEDITTTIRNYFIDFNETETLDDKQKKKCMKIITKLEKPTYINSIIREAKEMFYSKLHYDGSTVIYTIN